MSVRPVDISMMQRMQDVSQIKHNEVSKPIVDQSNIQQTITKEVTVKSEQVTKKDDADNHQKKYDAKEKGSGEYFSNASKNKKNKDDKEDKDDDNGRVFIKGQRNFDIKI